MIKKLLPTIKIQPVIFLGKGTYAQNRNAEAYKKQVACRILSANSQVGYL